MAKITKRNGKRGTTFKICVYEGVDAMGKPRRRFTTFKPAPGLSEKEAERQAQKFAVEFEDKISMGYNPDSKATFAEYAEYTLLLRERRGDKPQTLERVRRQLAQINKYIGGMRLTKITPRTINEMYDKLSAPGACRCDIYAVPVAGWPEMSNGMTNQEFCEACGVSYTCMERLKRGERIRTKNAKKVEKAIGKKLFRIEGNGRPLAPSTVRSYHSVISSVFEFAMKELIVDFNPAERATLPKMRKVRKQRALQPDEIAAILDAADTERMDMKTMLYMFVVTGCRRGEILGLKWSDVDFEKNMIHVSRSVSYVPHEGVMTTTTKTDTERYISLPAEIVALLRKYKAWQSEIRLATGDQWHDEDFVFCRWNGRPHTPTAVNDYLIHFSEKYDLPQLHPHIFRHTAASILLSEGVDVLTVAKMLGHAKPTTTLQVYAHEIEEARTRTADCISETILQRRSV